MGLRLLRRATAALLAILAGSAMLVMVVLTFVDVIGRYGFHASVFGASEMISWLMVVVTLMVGLVGFAALRGWNWNGALTMTGQQVMETAASYGLSVIPLFILMGIFIHRANISQDLFRAAYGLVGHYRGGLAQASVLACAAFPPSPRQPR